jgi:hypothetical protein
MNTHYPSQIGQKTFFWIQDSKTKVWILGRQRTDTFKNGRLKAPTGWWEQKCYLAPDKATEEEILRMFAQLENDLLFELAAGARPPITRDKSIRQHLDEVFKALQNR